MSKTRLLTFFIINILLLIPSVIILKSGEILFDEFYVEVKDLDVLTKENYAILTLYTEKGSLDMIIDLNQAQSIIMALKNETPYRPLTHDIISNILNETYEKIIAVAIEKLENDTYFANLYITCRGKIKTIDIRPSDGIAIALRLNIPIYVNKYLIKEKETERKIEL